MFISVSGALKNPGQSYPFESAVTLPAMEVMGDPLQFEDIVIKGEVVGTGEHRHRRGAFALLPVSGADRAAGERKRGRELCPHA